jgi:hypothetical protein
MSNRQADLILTGRYLLTMDPAQSLIEQGAVSPSAATRILAVGKAADLLAAYPGTRSDRRAPRTDHARSGECPHPCGHVLFPGPCR